MISLGHLANIYNYYKMYCFHHKSTHFMTKGWLRSHLDQDLFHASFSVTTGTYFHHQLFILHSYDKVRLFVGLEGIH